MLVSAEGRKFPSYRCLVPASELLISRHGERYRFSLADGDWFCFAGTWRPASEGWAEAYAILTIEANADVAPYQDRQMGRVEMSTADGLVGSLASRTRADSAIADWDIPN
jgi:putative SOS response-associated peptidase YedK